MSRAAAADFSAPAATIHGADGATITFSSSTDFLKIEYATEATRPAERTVFLAFDTDPHTGSSVLPFEKSHEGSTVFLPFNAEVFYCVNFRGELATATKRTWNISQWTDRTDATSELKIQPGEHTCTVQIPWPSLGGSAGKTSLVVFSKNLRANDGWGEMFGCADATVSAGIGDKTIPGYFEYSNGKNTIAVYRQRLATGTRVRIYQLLVRLFGNTNETRKINGTLQENGVGKFNDINDAALQSIAEMDFTHVWLTGVLQQATATEYPEIERARRRSRFAQRPRRKSLCRSKDYFDVCPDYAVDPKQRLAEFKALLERVHAHGMKAIIDFVPNHVARSYKSRRDAGHQLRRDR